MYTHVCVYMYVCMYVCLNVACMYTYIYIYVSQYVWERTQQIPEPQALGSHDLSDCELFTTCRGLKSCCLCLGGFAQAVEGPRTPCSGVEIINHLLLNDLGNTDHGELRRKDYCSLSVELPAEGEARTLHSSAVGRNT